MEPLSHYTGDQNEFHSDQHNSGSGFEPARPPLSADPCDFLLDAIDAQLGNLQVKNRQLDRIDSAPFRLSQAPSKDTGLGSTVSQTNDTPMSCLDLQVTPAVQQTADSTSSVAPATHEVATWELDVRTSGKVQMESHKEQVMWRLERLLGDTCKQGTMSSDPHPPSESICTEDFVRCFREEMVELALPEGSLDELDKQGEAERTLMTSSGDPCLSRQNTQKGVRSEATTNVKSSKQEPEQSEELGRCSSETSGVQTSHVVFYSTEVEKEHQNPKHIISPKARCLAGIPVRNFDTVSVDSDLDSVCTDQVRQHLCRRAVQKPTGAAQNKSTRCKAQQKCRPMKSLEDDDKDTDEESNGHWSRRSELEKASEKMHSAWEKMSERLSSLRQRCEKVEETLRMKKSHLTEVELSLSELQLRRKHAFHDLERLSAETGHLETEKSQLEVVLKDCKAEINSLSCQLQNLQRQKESHLRTVRNLQEELKKREQLEQLSCVETSRATSELERQLGCANAELFSERRRAREKQESMQQMLEETCEELLRASEAQTSLRNRCSSLEEMHKQKKEEIENLECQAEELRGKLGACTAKVDTLEKLLGQKEQQLQELQEQHGGLQTERERLKGELEFLKSQQHSALQEAREHARTMMEAALKQQRKDLVSIHEQQMQKLKKDDAKALKNSLEHQKEESRKREEELRAQTLQTVLYCEPFDKTLRGDITWTLCSSHIQVHKAIDEERRKWEADKIAAVHFHRGLLEEQNRRDLETAQSELHREKANALTLQRRVAELQSRVQELEAERCVQQREQESLLSAVCKSLKQERRDELDKLQKHMLQESGKTELQLEQAVRKAEAETERIGRMLEEQRVSHLDARAEQEQQLGVWAQELVAQCEFLRLLIEKNGGQQNAVQLPRSSTIDEALAQLKAQQEPLKHLIEYLHQEFDSQRQASEQLLKDKERALRIQREQMRMEQKQALDSLKNRLIQDHVEELSSLKWAHWSAAGLEASLRKQLEDKDMELRQVQRNMTQWKEQTTARLACKFEEELTAELERKTSMNEEEQLRTEGQRRLSAKAASPQTSSDVASLKLVHYLQSRVKQLRVENQTWVPTGPNFPTHNHQESRKA
ncbi:trichohyalin isoform X2 [Hippocampus zosterae]|uniref:trichohyalin isoform X2 n=1 Tax=Hippocampus zosterae TaxID=109293 RepID=UPI00223CD2C7|nr:trichohyalin isoform X2 [Hippocampus zosterae]